MVKLLNVDPITSIVSWPNWIALKVAITIWNNICTPANVQFSLHVVNDLGQNSVCVGIWSKLND
jgi:hypothetical protein